MAKEKSNHESLVAAGNLLRHQRTASDAVFPLGFSHDDGARAPTQRPSKVLAAKPYQCEECSASYCKRSELDRHQLKHTGERPYCCAQCSKSFQRPYDLKRHVSRHAGESAYRHRCHMCAKAYRRSDLLLRHRQTHFADGQFACEVCGAEFADESLLDDHRRTHKAERPYWCPECPKRLASAERLRAHLSNHFGERSFRCGICQQAFASDQSRGLHERNHGRSRERPHRCVMCNKAYATEQRLLVHHQKHLKTADVFACAACEKKYASLHSLARHTLLHHTGPPKPARPAGDHVCHECGKSYGTPRNLRRHSLVHSGSRPHQCAECGMAFMRHEHLVRHERAHAGDSRYRCERCDKPCRDAFLLRTHLQRCNGVRKRSGSQGETIGVRDGNRGYKCGECSKSFKRRKRLKRHMQMHAAAAAEANGGDGEDEKGKLIAHHSADDAKDAIDSKLKPSSVQTATETFSFESLASMRNSLSCHQQEPDRGHFNISHGNTAALTETERQTIGLLCHRREEGLGASVEAASMGGWTSSKEPSMHSLMDTSLQTFLEQQGSEAFGHSQSFSRCVSQGRLAVHPLSDVLMLRNDDAKNVEGDNDSTDAGPIDISRHNSTNETMVYLAQKQAGYKSPVFSDKSPAFGYKSSAFDDKSPAFGDKSPAFGDKSPAFGDKFPASGDTSLASAHDLPQRKAELVPVGFSGGISSFPAATHRCYECNLTFKKRSTLVRHQYRHTGERPFQCEECAGSFTRMFDLKRHRLSHSDDATPHFRCQICAKNFRRLDSLMHHHRKHFSEGQHGCVRCGRAFANESELTEHETTHRAERGYKCPECDKTCASADALQKHLLSHSLERPFECVKCKRTFASEQLLEAHQKTHVRRVRKSVAGTFSCAPCTKTYADRHGLYRHNRLNHRGQPKRNLDTGERLFICDECGKSYKDNRGLRRHQFVHAGVRPYQCAVCGMGFLRAHHVRRHEQTHTGLRPYECSKCEKSYRDVSCFRNHMRQYHPDELQELAPARKKPGNESTLEPCDKEEVDEGSSVISLKNETTDAQEQLSANPKGRSFECCVCGKSFATRRNLRRHESVHAGERPYECMQCSKSFHRKEHLMKHIRSHACHQPSSLECSLCDEAFTSLKDLRCHKRTWHAETLFRCAECEKSFCSESRLEKHQAKKHDGGPSLKLRKMKHDASVGMRRNLTLRETMQKDDKRHFECLLCDQRFTTGKHLKRHQLVHSGVRAYACEICGVSFAHSHHLKRHLARKACGKPKGRQRKNPFECPHCVKAFGDLQGVTEHVLAVHVPIEAQFGCGRCIRSFQSADDASACFLGHDAAVLRENGNTDTMDESSSATLLNEDVN